MKVAIESLRIREEIPEHLRADYIGSLTNQEAPGSDPIRSVFVHWLQENNLDAVIWTNLPAKFSGVNGIKPSKEEAIEYLKTLEGEAKKRAEQYIRKAPAQIMTNYRIAFEAELGLIHENEIKN